MPDLQDGESIEMRGSGSKPYVLKNVGGVYSCSCPAWRNQSLAIEKRTCKHLRRLRGDKAEEERSGGAVPERAKEAKKGGPAPPLLLAERWDGAMNLAGYASTCALVMDVVDGAYHLADPALQEAEIPQMPRKQAA